MAFPFIVSENDTSLRSTATGTKADARAQARAMLAADALLTTCQSVLDSLERNRPTIACRRRGPRCTRRSGSR